MFVDAEDQSTDYGSVDQGEEPGIAHERSIATATALVALVPDPRTGPEETE